MCRDDERPRRTLRQRQSLYIDYPTSLSKWVSQYSIRKIKTLTKVSVSSSRLKILTGYEYAFVGESAFATRGLQSMPPQEQAHYEHIDPALIGNERRFLISELTANQTSWQMERRYRQRQKDGPKKFLPVYRKLENEGYQFEAAEASFDLLVKKIIGTYNPLSSL